MGISDSIQSIDFLTAIRESALVYPSLLGTHLACIAFFGGMILMTDLRLLGVSLKSLTITEVVERLAPVEALGRRHHDHMRVCCWERRKPKNTPLILISGRRW